MTNDTIPGERVNVETLKYWYNHYGQGSKYNLDFCINGINDNRSYVTPDELRDRYGIRIADRFREMIEQIIFEDGSYRK